MALPQMFSNGRWWAKVVTAIGVVWLAVSLSACDRGKEAEKKQAAPAPPPPDVVVAEVIQKTVPIYSDFVAQTEAKETVEIRARVQAFLEAQHFDEGTVVKKDQILFTLDKREYEAQLLQPRRNSPRPRRIWRSPRTTLWSRVPKPTLRLPSRGSARRKRTSGA